VDEDRDAIVALLDYWTPLLLRMCVESGVITAFGSDARSADDVAARTDLHGPTLARVLRALTSRGIFEACDDGNYRLTRLGDRLLPDVPGSLAGMAAFRPWQIHAWAEATHSLTTGQASFPHYFEQDVWDYLASNPAMAATFNEQMQRRTTTLLDLGLHLYDWPDQGTVVDLGGGNGLLLTRVLTAQPGLRGVLFDLPHVVEHARPLLSRTGVLDRVEIVAGDLLGDDLPTEHDLYVLASVLHDWDDQHAERILLRCHNAMPPTGRLVLFESVLPPGPDPDHSKLLDLHMLVLFGAKERTSDEWQDLLSRSGFELQRVVPTPGLAWIEAIPQP
jgi:O-methyltransferase